MSEDQAVSQPTGPRRRGLWLIVALAAVIVIALGVWYVRPSGEVEVDRVELTSGSLAGWNVVLVSMDTVRHDRLHCYGRKQIDTPVLDGLAREGVRFSQAVAPVPMTLPSHATMLTGLDPHHHGARVNGMFKLNDDVPTLATVLGQAGYRTGAVIAAFVLDRRFGLARGFDHYDDDLSSGRSSYEFGYRERPADLVNKAAEAWLRKSSDKPFFLFVHYFDPHWPYTAPEPFAGKYKDNFYGDYDEEIAYTDHQLGKLLGVLDEIGQRDKTLIVVTSDHGEGLDQHNEKTHSLLVYDTTLRVPLIISGPSPLPHGRLMPRQVGLIDIMPTVLDLVGVSSPAPMDGVSLLSPLPPEPRSLYVETLGSKFLHGWAPLVGVRREDYKLIIAPRSELYDVQTDPDELRNLLRSKGQIVRELQSDLRKLLGGDPELVGHVSANLTMDDAARQKLADLGYVQTASPSTRDAASKPVHALPDPKDMILAQKRIHQAQTMMTQGQYEEALIMIKPYLAKHDTDGLALQVAGQAYRRTGQLDKAVELFRKATKLRFEPEEAYAGLAMSLYMLDKLDEAEAAAKQGLKLDPTCANALLVLGMVRGDQERDEEAMQLFKRVLEKSRGTYDANAHFCMYRLHLARGRVDEARQALEKVLAVSPNHSEAIRAMAMMADSEANREATIARLRKAVETRSSPQLLLELGRLEFEQGDHEAASKTLSQVLRTRPDNSNAHYLLARSLQALGRQDKVMFHLTEAVRLDPSNHDAVSALGLALAGAGRLQEAHKHLKDAARMAPDVATRHYNLGVILHKLGQTSQAVDAFREATRLDPNNAAAHFNLGQLLKATGKQADADKHLRRARELNPDFGK